MRLLDTTTHQLHEFFGSKIPAYAILSHRWDDKEVTYQDVQDRTILDSHRGFKVRNACALARAWENTYIWIDTCCIDKTSSAEITEAINSMFSWYQGACVCYAYLKDVPSGLDPHEKEDIISKSEWFKRGWTLQELLAPRTVIFVSDDWEENLGSRTDLASVISKVTGIKDEDFEKLRRNNVSIARRMSWASSRACTREEDEAYCLMGLLGVNMPLLYGEGKNAFQRLQYEILKGSDDESIFAWWTPRNSIRTKLGTGMLARSPHDFRHSAEAHPWPFDRDARPYSMTNKGLQIEPVLLPLSNLASPDHQFMDPNSQLRPIRFTESQQGHLYAITLNCCLTSPRVRVEPAMETSRNPVILLLRRLTDSSNTYCRMFVSEMLQAPSFYASNIQKRQRIFIRSAISVNKLATTEITASISITGWSYQGCEDGTEEVP